MIDDRCEYSGLLRNHCAHCGANPGSRPELEPPGSHAPRPGRQIDTSTPIPPTYPTRKLGKSSEGICPCGVPTRDNAYGCDDCADELSRLLGDAPWLNEQLELTITKQRGKTPGASAKANDGLPWNPHAAKAQKAFRDALLGIVTTCVTDHVRHQSPSDTKPTKTIPSMSAWLLWRVDGLQYHQSFPNILKRALATEARILAAIDRGPDLLYLGVCSRDQDGEQCGGAIYAKDGEDVGRCRVCDFPYDVTTGRANLTARLDRMLCTPAEIAHLATYLGLDVEREKVRKIVNQWSKRERIAPAPGTENEPRFRFGEVAAMLVATYTKSA